VLLDERCGWVFPAGGAIGRVVPVGAFIVAGRCEWGLDWV
jgi:hypothetical protein